MTKAELKIMRLLWENGDMHASEITKAMNRTTGWKKSTTYTVLGTCIDKGYIKRMEPGFVCHALVGRQEMQKKEVANIVENLFEGSRSRLFSAMIDKENIDSKEIEEIKKIISEME